MSAPKMSRYAKFRVWWLANVSGWPWFRVTYPNGEVTYRLPKAEAKGLKEVFGGKMWLDYEHGYKILKECF